MTRAIIIYLALALSAPPSAFSAAPAFDTDRFLDATRLVENLHGQPGRLGELGPYQIREITWRQHMPGVPFIEARKEGPARTCARRHVTWLRSQLRAAGVDDGPLMTAVAWNAGLAQTLRGRAPPRAWDYAHRVTNLYEDRP